MATLLNKIPGNLTEYPNSFKRLGAFPLEAYSVFYAKTDAEEYASSDPIAYVGQIIVVVEGNSATVYVISSTLGTLTKLATFEGVEGDINEVKNSLNDSLNKLLTRFNTLVGYKDDNNTGVTDLSIWHAEHEESINKINETLEKISSKTYFSVQLVDEVDIEKKQVKLKGASEKIDAVYGIIYLLKDDSVTGEDIYKEYMLVLTGFEKDVEGNFTSTPTYGLLLTGTTSTDLKDYVLKGGTEPTLGNISPLIELQNSILSLDTDDTTVSYIIKFDNEGAPLISRFEGIDEGILSSPPPSEEI